MYGFSLRFFIVEERSYLQVPCVRGHVTMTSTSLLLYMFNALSLASFLAPMVLVRSENFTEFFNSFSNPLPI